METLKIIFKVIFGALPVIAGFFIAIFGRKNAKLEVEKAQAEQKVASSEQIIQEIKKRADVENTSNNLSDDDVRYGLREYTTKNN